MVCKELRDTLEKPRTESLEFVEKRVTEAKQHLSSVVQDSSELKLNHDQLQAWIVSESLVISTALKLFLTGKDQGGYDSKTETWLSTKNCQVRLEAAGFSLALQDDVSGWADALGMDMMVPTTDVTSS